MKQTRREFIKAIATALLSWVFVPGSPPRVGQKDVESGIKPMPSQHTFDGRLGWIRVTGARVACGHCDKQIYPDDAEGCWYCNADLCVDCWERIGHCGHVEAHRQNHKAALVKQPGVPLMTVRRVYWSEDDLGQFWTADLYQDGVKIGVTGNYYDDIDDETGQRYSREDQVLMCSEYLCEHGRGEDCVRCLHPQR